MKKREKDINLIPKSYILKKSRRKAKLFRSTAATAVSLAVAAMLGLPLALRFKLQHEKDTLEAEVMKTMNYVKTENQFAMISELFKQREDEAAKLMKMGVNLPSLMETIEKASPERLFITGMSVTSAEAEYAAVSLNGVSAGEDEIASFTNRLRRDAAFTRVLISSVKLVEAAGAENQSGRQFMFSMELEYKKGEAK